MAVDHRVGLCLGEFFRRLALLGLLGEDTNTAAVEVLDQPGEVNVEARIPFAGPAVPSNATRLAVNRCNIFDNLRLDRKAERFEIEGATVFQFRFLLVVEQVMAELA